MTPGIYAMPAAEYHGDPCEVASLSASIAHELCTNSPAHAREKHPKLNPTTVHEQAEHFDIGTAVHSILLEGVNSVEVLDFPDWRTNASKDARDAARKAGKTPLLRKVWAEVESMMLSTRGQLDAHEDGCDMFVGGQAEQTLIWEEPSGIWCRSRLDYLRPGAIDDYKTTSTTANPEAVTRQMFGNGWDIKAAFYLRGLRALTGTQATMRFAVQETYAPYALSVVTLGPDAMTLAEKKVLYALELWAECLERKRWPGYPTRTAYATLPEWVESAWLKRELAYAV